MSIRGRARTLATLATLVALAGCTSAQGDPEPGDAPTVSTRFPGRVFLRTGKLAFNSFFSFALDEQGRIWVRPLKPTKETEGFPDEWRLLGTGLPENADKPDFVKPERIVAIDADADELMAISETHRHYSLRWLPNPVFAGTPRRWTDIEGWPVEGPHVWDARVLDNRGWGIGRRNQLCEWFEDIEGKSHWGGGGLTTYYFLSRDGTEIYFSDSGLPPDFSHTLAGPRRSTFEAVGFAVSASTMFVIDRYGELFTRLADFDTSGCDVMFFEYTYDRRNKKATAISIPGEDWLRHAKIPIVGKARISSQITVALTGNHNSGRELRVGGLDADGGPGYYAKPIFFQKEGMPHREEVGVWTFHPVPDLELDPARLLDQDDCRRVEPGAGAPSRDVAMQGKLEANGKLEPVSIELLDWNVECSPATLRISADGDHVDLTFHTVEEWYHLKRLDPGRDGTPKNFLGTIEIPATAQATKNPRLKEILERDFALYDLADFAFWVEGTQDYVAVEPREKGFSARGRPDLALSFTRDGAGFRSIEAARRESLHRNAFVVAASSRELMVESPLATFADAKVLSSKIARNESVRRDLRSAFEENSQLDARTPFYVTWPGIHAVKALGTLLGGAAFWAPYVKNLMGELPALISRNDELKQRVLLISRDDYEEADAVLGTRIAAYDRRLTELASGVQKSDWTYHESTDDAWSTLRFGARGTAVVTAASRAAWEDCRGTVDDSELASGDPSGSRRPRGLVIDIAWSSQGSARTRSVTLRVIPRAVVKKVYESSLKGAVGATGNPLVLDARVTLDYVVDSPAAQELVKRIFPPSEGRMADVVPARLTVEGGTYSLAVSGLVFAWKKESP